jgi:hypothetical protein
LKARFQAVLVGFASLYPPTRCGGRRSNLRVGWPRERRDCRAFSLIDSENGSECRPAEEWGGEG